jgi:hypothetical protein
MSLSAFFANNVQSEITEEVVVSERFKDEDGNPIPWKLRTMTEAENEQLRKSSTKMQKQKKGMQLPDLDPDLYVAKMVVACVVYPNLKDAELLQSYGVMAADELLKKMLLAGEYATLAEKVQEINGFDKDINDLAEDVKN